MFHFQKNDPPCCGGVTDNTDHDAPKEIRSKTIVDFAAGFFLYDRWGGRTGGRTCFFTVKKEGDAFYLKESYGKKEKLLAPPDLLQKVQEVVDRHELVRLNGVHRHTAGLPYEFSPAFLDAEYDSGEVLSFSMNGDPYAEWAADLVDLFGAVYAAAGDRSFLPPVEALTVTRCILEYTKDGIFTQYSDCYLYEGENGEEQVLRYIRFVFDRNRQETVSEVWMPFTEGFFEGIGKIVEAYGFLKSRQSGGGAVMAAAPEPDSDETFRLYLEMKDGYRPQVETKKASEIEKYRPLREALSAYLDGLFEKYGKEME